METPVTMNIAIFSDITPRSLVEVYRRFRVSCYFHHQATLPLPHFSYATNSNHLHVLKSSHIPNYSEVSLNLNHQPWNGTPNRVNYCLMFDSVYNLHIWPRGRIKQHCGPRGHP